jgi:hypothetical protein
MRLRVVVAAVGGAVVVGVGATFAAHAPEIDPTTGYARSWHSHDVARRIDGWSTDEAICATWHANGARSSGVVESGRA